MPTPSWPDSNSIGPHGFAFPSSFQDSFHKAVRIDELDENVNTDEANINTAEKNRLDRLRKESALTISIPQSSGYDSYEDNSKDSKRSSYHVMDIEQDSIQEQKQFLDSSDGSGEGNRRKKRTRNKCYWSKCKIGLTIIGGTLILFGVIFGAIYLSKYLESSDDSDGDDISTNHSHVQIVTTPKSQIPTNETPSIDHTHPLVAIRMVVDEDYVENGKGHVVLWRPPQGKHIQQGITYNNGSFKVPMDGYYTYTSTLVFDTRNVDKETGKEIRFHHCVNVKNTQQRTCSTNGVPVNAIRSDIVYDSLVHLSAGQEVYVTISKLGFISDTSDSNTFTMRLSSKHKKTR
ncbi:uncharacterized protein LOC117342122 [Pecten maximus]|uniref:uncharacterized protein LOC117342122 n=1 Tax=Pecten maximus TaxID=6579 RepID=UPI00145914BF|nr:uncharacterized protein LOC117342122 [Pecten maximus]